MKVLLINIDSVKIPNIALLKIEKYHKAQGHEVFWDIPLISNQVDRIYVSCVFAKNKPRAAQYEMYDHAIIGGSGYDIKKTLPPEIENIKLNINIGHATRGCIRSCGFCIVPDKEGREVYPVADLYDIWDGISKDVMLLDNNILAHPEWFFTICRQARSEGVRLDFNQGLDHRLLTPEIVKALSDTSILQYRFAYDFVSMRKSVNRAIALLRAYGINQANWYVLIGYKSGIMEALKRLNHLRFFGHVAFAQRYVMEPEYIPVARWANQRHLFRVKSFPEFLKMSAKAAYYKRIFGEPLYYELTNQKLPHGR